MNNSPLSADDCKIFSAKSQLYCYVPITKVASTYLFRALPAQSFDIHNWCWIQNSELPPHPSQVRYLVVLRDPLERWISGAVEFWCRARPDRDWNLITEDSDIFDQIEFDVHTRPQIDFLHCIDRTQTTWLYMNHSVENHPWFAANNVKLRDVDNQDRNWGNARPQIYFFEDQRLYAPIPGAVASTPSAIIQKNLRRVIDTSARCRDKIVKYYQQDFELIQSVDFS